MSRVDAGSMRMRCMLDSMNTVNATMRTGTKMAVPWWRICDWLAPSHLKDLAIDRIKSQPFFNPTTTRKA